MHLKLIFGEPLNLVTCKKSISLPSILYQKFLSIQGYKPGIHESLVSLTWKGKMCSLQLVNWSESNVIAEESFDEYRTSGYICRLVERLWQLSQETSFGNLGEFLFVPRIEFWQLIIPYFLSAEMRGIYFGSGMDYNVIYLGKDSLQPIR